MIASVQQVGEAVDDHGQKMRCRGRESPADVAQPASREHRDNLAYAAYDRTGVGASVANNTIYVTELFATNLGLRSPQDPALNLGGGAR